MSIAEVVAIVAFLSFGGLVFLVMQTIARWQQDPIRERLAAAALREPLPTDTSGNSALSEAFAGQLPTFKSDTEALDQELRRAGFYRPSARSEFLAIRNALVIVAVIVTGGVAVYFGPDAPMAVLYTFIGGAVGALLCWALPRLYLKVRGYNRVTKIRRALPDSLDMITMCLTGGLSLQDALAHISKEIYFAHPDLAVELVIVCQQAKMRSFDLAFKQFSKRIDAPEIQTLSSLVSQGQRLGTDIVSSIRDYADDMRLKRRQLADEKAGKAGVQMLFPLTLCCLPSVFILMWGARILDLRDFLRETFQGDVPPI
jgi:tight adherence protein C